jgi:hypothetical protein
VSGAQVCYTAPNTIEWGTPQDFFDELNEEFGFTLDVAASADNAKCARHFTEADDGLAQGLVGRCVLDEPALRAGDRRLDAQGV